MVSFLFPKEYRDFLSFLLLCDAGEESAGDGEGEGVVAAEGLGAALLHGEAGAD